MTIKIVPWLLMPISNITSWVLIVSSPRGDSAAVLLERVWKIATFYMLWALYNKYLGGRPQELGHVSMGLMAITAFFRMKYPSMAACALVILNFAVVVPIIVSNGPKGLAKLLYKDTSALTMVWAYTFVMYILSNVCLWCYVMYRLYLDLVGTSRSTTSGGSAYEPVLEEGNL
jgi:hypothetical protein